MIKILYPHPALLLKEENKKHIIISDLHIGVEERFVKKGISIETSTEKMKRLLIKLIQQYQPEDVIILDLHTIIIQIFQVREVKPAWRNG